MLEKAFRAWSILGPLVVVNIIFGSYLSIISSSIVANVDIPIANPVANSALIYIPMEYIK